MTPEELDLILDALEFRSDLLESGYGQVSENRQHMTGRGFLSRADVLEIVKRSRALASRLEDES